MEKKQSKEKATKPVSFRPFRGIEDWLAKKNKTDVINQALVREKMLEEQEQKVKQAVEEASQT